MKNELKKALEHVRTAEDVLDGLAPKTDTDGFLLAEAGNDLARASKILGAMVSTLEQEATE